MELQEIINKAKEHKVLVGMYGLGVWGRGFAWRLFSYLEINIDFVSDSDVKKMNDFEMKCIRKLAPEELLQIESETIVFVMIGQFYIREIEQMLKKNSNLKLVTLDEILNLDIVLEQFYGVKNIRQFEKEASFKIAIREKNIGNYINGDKIAVYTCIINGYDELKEPLIVEKNCDYFLISDKKPSNLEVFKWIDYKLIVPEKYDDPAVINRYCKMHAHEIFKNYRYSIYMDGKVQVIRKISKYINNLGGLGIGIHKHGFMDCIYVEGIRMVGSGCSDEAGVARQMREYILEGMPRNFGTFECRMIVRDHNNVLGNQIMEQWFEEYYHKERRDQFSLSYIIWKNGLKCNDVGLINNGLPWAENSDIECRKEHLK